MKIKEFFSVNNDCYKKNIAKTDSRFANFQKDGPKGLMLHSVGCPQQNAEVFAKSWNNAGGNVAVHAVLQEDGTVYQCLPWNFRGWHAGGSANNTHIGVEMTEPDCIKYTSGSNFTCSNLAKAQEQAKGTYKTAVELFAYLCKEFKLDPMKDIISHKEGCTRGIASNHGDPEHLWRQLKLGYTMDGFRKDVKAEMNKTTSTTTTTSTTSKTTANTLYKVQVGAYKTKKNAENQVAKLKTAGFEAIIVVEDNLYKVQVGSYTVKANADNAVAKLKAAGFTACIKTVKTEATLKVGDKVQLKKGAYVYNKSYTFQNWVYSSTLYVRAIDNDKVTVSTQSVGAITGIVNIKDIIKL